MKQENPIIVFVVISSYFIFSVNVDSPYFLVSGANAIHSLAPARLHKHRAPEGLAPPGPACSGLRCALRHHQILTWHFAGEENQQVCQPLLFP